MQFLQCYKYLIISVLRGWPVRLFILRIRGEAASLWQQNPIINEKKINNSISTSILWSWI